MRAIARAGRLSRNGFSLPVVLVAALLFSVSLLGLIQYHQVLLQSFQRQWDYRLAWG
uniref:type IV pilus modification PilV family protein n=1 Tax=Serratia bockelmannii TaxID=2703793 RepID=UPI003CF966E9